MPYGTTTDNPGARSSGARASHASAGVAVDAAQARTRSGPGLPSLAKGAVVALSALWSLLPAHATDVAIIRHVRSGEGGGDSQRVIDGFVDRVRRTLCSVGIGARTFDDRSLTADQLARFPLAILPHNPGVPGELVGVLEAYVKAGGKLAMFYSSDARLLRLVGVEGATYRRRVALPQFHGVRFDTAVLRGAPPMMPQSSWSIAEPRPAPEGAAVVGTWIDHTGSDTGLVAATLHPNGLAFAHVLLADDPPTAGRFLLALVGHFVEGVWGTAVAHRLGDADREVANLAGAQSTKSVVRGTLAKMCAEYRRVEALLESGDAPAAYDAAARAQALAERAFLLSRESREHELRGVWIHSAYGIGDWGWDRTVRVLAENGFNAIFPNMLWGAVADYPSDVLPVHPKVAEKGDQIEQCLAACRKHGIEMHVWKVNWNMGTHTPKEVRDRFAAAGRTQVSVRGKPSSFLAPHLQENFELERDAMLEVVRKYDVDGIHFDYIRYPNADCDFSDSARKAFEQWLGEPVALWPTACYSGDLRPKYNEWRRGNITRLVRAVYEGAHAIKPQIAVSAAVFGNWERSPDSIAQATLQWSMDGWLDFVCPMNYTASDDTLSDLLTGQTIAVAGRVPIYCGIGSWQHADPAATARQIDMTRALGADGFVCFSHNPRFADVFLPALGLGTTAAKTVPPHHSVSMRFMLPPTHEDLDGQYRVGQLLRVAIRPRAPETEWRAPQVSLSRNGRPFGQAGDVEFVPTRTGVVAAFRPGQPGWYRLVARGESRGDGASASSPVFARSGPLRVVSDEQADELIARAGPPRFANTGGVRVAIWHDGFGALPLFDALSEVEGLDAVLLYNLKPTTLRACEVVVLLQPRHGAKRFSSEQTVGTVRDYVQQGGGVLVTHALVGIRGLEPYGPHVATGGEAMGGSHWQAAADHAVTGGLAGQVHESTFGDRISVVAGEAGTVVATTADGVPVMAVGPIGRGRYAACGLGIGIGPGDEDVKPSDAERVLVRNTIHWLSAR